MSRPNVLHKFKKIKTIRLFKVSYIDKMKVLVICYIVWFIFDNMVELITRKNIGCLQNLNAKQ